MDVKLTKVFFLLSFLFSGAYAKDPRDGSRSLPYHGEFHLRRTNLDSHNQHENPKFRRLEENPIQKGGRTNLASVQRVLLPQTEPEPLDTISRRDVVTPITTVPTFNPSTPTTTTPMYNPLPTPAYPTPIMNPVTNPYATPTYRDTAPTNPATNPAVGNPTSPTPTMGNPTSPTPTMGNPTSPTPTMGNPTSGGQSWCVASPSASQTALQVGLDYACGYGGADCSAIQQGGSCFNPDTVRDHASYAFNMYYQKNPMPTSCDFSGTAMITNTDPSTSTCHYPSSSTSSSTLNTTNPTGGGSTVFGSSPPDYTNTSSSLMKAPSSSTLICFLTTLVYLKVYA